VKLLVLSIEFPPGPGGIGTLAYQIASRLCQLGWYVTVLTPQHYADSDEIAQFNASQPFAMQRMSYVGPFIFEGVYRFIIAYRAVRERDPDVFLAVGEQAVWLGALLSFLGKRPFVAVGVGTEFVRGGWLRHWLTRWAFSRAHRLIAISSYTETLMANAGIDVQKSEVVLCGADSEIYRPISTGTAVPHKWAFENTKVILTVGQVSARKAQDIVIQALPYVVKKLPDVKYFIVGLPSNQPRLEALATALGVADRVVFLGKVVQEELPALYNRADLFVLVSRQTSTGDVEGYGIVVTEAALCGTPAIVSNHSGLVETVIEGVTGLIVEPENPKATADAISRLLLDDSLRQQMGRAAQKYALENATWAKRIGRYDQLLRELLAESK
jgi:phosphatidylinositol alpha-1,6-mannosyltransferase